MCTRKEKDKRFNGYFYCYFCGVFFVDGFADDVCAAFRGEVGCLPFAPLEAAELCCLHESKVLQ